MDGILDLSCMEQAKATPINVGTILKALCLVTITVITVCGNGLVVIAVTRYKSLRTTNCRLLASLAAADLSLGLAVLPISTVTELYQSWIFGNAMCHIWLSTDILLCTASIYSLTLISTDRYMALARPLFYRSRITESRTKLMIIAFWTIALAICLPTIIPFDYFMAEPPSNLSMPYGLGHWDDARNQTSSAFLGYTAARTCKCTPLNNSPIYIIFSSIGSFFLPTVWIMFSYGRIIAITRRTVRCNEINILEYQNNKRREHNDRKSNDMSCVIALMEHASANVCAKQVDIDIPKKIEINRRKDNEDNIIRIHRGRSQSHDVICHKPENDNADLRSTKISVGEANLRFDTGKSFEVLLQHHRLAAINLFATQDLRPNIGAISREAASDTVLQLQTRTGSSVSTATICPDSRNHKRTNVLERIYQQTAKDHQSLLRELRILRGIGIMTGCFICCWLGFAICYVLQAFPFCRRLRSCIPDWLFSLVFWLGYSNSALNPFIYALCHRDFRRAFQKMIRIRRRAQYSGSNFCNRPANI